MPELPEVETVRRGLADALEGRRLVRVAARRRDLRVPLPAHFSARLRGRRVTRIDRRGKYLLVRLDGGCVLVVHLGMSGRLLVARRGTPHGGNGPPPLTPHDHVLFETDAGTVIRYRDARRFGLMALAREDGLAAHPLLARLGLEPLEAGFDGPALTAALSGRGAPIKTVLMDQRVVAGLGNIYACESLFRARLSPRRKARTVRGARAAGLAAAIREVLTEAIAAGGSSLRDHVRPGGELGTFQHHFAVYGREGEPCPGCGCRAGVRRIVQSGRSTFYCPTCQR